MEPTLCEMITLLRKIDDGGHPISAIQKSDVAAIRYYLEKHQALLEVISRALK